MKEILLTILFFSSLYGVKETNVSITNLEGEIAEEERVPNIYLKDGSTNLGEPLSPTKRFDAVYFISLPVTYYLTFNLLQQKNWYLRQSFTLDKSDELFLYFNTFFLPFIVAYFDYIFVSEYKLYNYNIGNYLFKDSIVEFSFYIKQF